MYSANRGSASLVETIVVYCAGCFGRGGCMCADDGLYYPEEEFPHATRDEGAGAQDV